MGAKGIDLGRRVNHHTGAKGLISISLMFSNDQSPYLYRHDTGKKSKGEKILME